MSFFFADECSSLTQTVFRLLVVVAFFSISSVVARSLEIQEPRCQGQNARLGYQTGLSGVEDNWQILDMMFTQPLKPKSGCLQR